jgi:hypothetical protein
VFTEVDAAGHDLLDMSFVSAGNWSTELRKSLSARSILTCFGKPPACRSSADAQAMGQFTIYYYLWLVVACIELRGCRCGKRRDCTVGVVVVDNSVR